MDVLKILQSVPIFVGLNPSLIERIMPLLHREEYRKDDKIIEEGNVGNSMFILLKGSVRVTKYGQDHKEILISNMETGSYFGELSLVDNLPRSANVLANEDSVLLSLGKNAFEKLLSENKDFAITFYKNCMKETMSRIRETASNLTLSQNVLYQKSSRLDLIDADLVHAAKIQDYFLNTNLLKDEQPLIAGVKQSYIYKPYLEVGGDFLNIAKISNDKLGIVIADVMGHGISAALATGVMKSAFILFVKKYGKNPVKLMTRMNAHFYEIFSSLYATGYYALIDMAAKKIRMTKAGHHHPLIWKGKDKNLAVLESPGPGLGIIPDAKFDELEVDIEPGDKLLFYTDGIIEQKNSKSEMYSQNRLECIFKQKITDGEKNILQVVLEDLTSFSGTDEYQDDISLLLFEF